MDVLERDGVGRRDLLILADLLRDIVDDRVLDLICVGVLDLLGKDLDFDAELDGVFDTVADTVGELYVVMLGTKVSVGKKVSVETSVVSYIVIDDEGLGEDVCDALDVPVADELEVDDTNELAVASRAAARIVKIFILYV